MKLADAQSDSARQKLRESNLDDLENAFKEESPLTESYDGSSRQLQGGSGKLEEDGDLYEAFPTRNATVTTSNDTLMLNGGGATEGVAGARNDAPRASFQDNEFQANASNIDMGGRNNDGVTFNPSRNNVMTSLVSNDHNDNRYGPVNPPRFEYRYSGYFQNRRQTFAAIIIVLAIIGLVIGLVAPGSGVFGSEYGDDWPSSAPTTDRMDTQMDQVFLKAADILNDAMVSYPFMLSKDCYHRECNGTGVIDGLDIRNQVVHFLVFEDSLFRTWLFNADFDNVERVVQRYIITLFAFETGLVKPADSLYSGGNIAEWKVNTWERDDNWLSREEECNWYGIICEFRSAYVNAEDFKDHTLFAGSTAVARDLPNRPVANIPMITRISLNQNGLSGTFIPELFKLRHLEMLELWKAELRGNLNRDIRLWASLKRLWVHETRYLTGTIPPEIGELSNLESVFIGGNELTGEIPSQFGNLKKLETLALHKNQFRGKIPKQLSACTELKRLFLDENDLDGALPIEFGLLTSLTDFRVNDNGLTGSLPLQFGELRNLEVLYIGDNKLSGDIADVTVIGWEKMTHFEAGGNFFTGTIPERFGTLDSLVTLDLHKNKFDSEVPRNICDGFNKSLKKIDFSDNMFIKGKIPVEIGKCSNLETLILSKNQITGQLPAALSSFQNLRVLDIDRNLLTGPIPLGIGGSSIRILRLIQNGLQDTIDENLCDKTDFISADCGNGGSVPCENNCCECCDLFCN
jgi:hypothetical protein